MERKRILIRITQLAVMVMVAAALLLLPVRSAHAMTFTVTNTNDSGGGSLRLAIQAANGNPGLDDINFAIPGGGPQTITLATDLPTIIDPVNINGNTELCTAFPCIVVRPSSFQSGTGFTVAASVTGGALRSMVVQAFTDGIVVNGNSVVVESMYVGTNEMATSIAGTGNLDYGIKILGSLNTVSNNVISGNGFAGISIVNTLGTGGTNFITHNLIGTNLLSTSALPNGVGIDVEDSPDNTIGGAAFVNPQGNVISGNSFYGIFVGDNPDPGGAENTSIRGNEIGTDITGTIAIPNGIDGIRVASSPGPVRIGSASGGIRNIIAFNGAHGLTVGPGSATGVQFWRNSIYANGAGGIYVSPGNNGGMLPPVITSVTPTGASGTACPNCLVWLYADAGGQGQTVFGAVNANGAGNWSFTGPVGGPNVTATALDFPGSSEFSAPFASTCWGTCMSGLHEGVYNSAASQFNNCTASVTQVGDGQLAASITGTIDCTTAHGGTLSGSINQATKVINLTLSFTSPVSTSSVTGTMSNDGSTGSGTWQCLTPSPCGPYTWSSGRVAASASAMIYHASGGRVTTDLGDYLDVPPLSVAVDTAVSIETIPLHVPAGTPAPPCVLSRAFRGQPDGTQFNPPATFVVHYDPTTDLPTGCSAATLQIMVYNSAFGRWMFVSSTPGPDPNSIQFSVPHFTDYAVFDCGTTDNDGPGGFQWIHDGVGPEGSVDTGPDACDANDDNAGCSDVTELGPSHTLGGQRDPLNPWDFADMWTPSLPAAGGRSGAITIADVIAVLPWIGTSKIGPPNSSGRNYTDDANANGVWDGVEYDRTPSTTPGQPWRLNGPNDAVSIADAIAVLGSIGDKCS